jgi:hypothetical protein
MKFEYSGQGTIEYLVVLAAIIVISLVTVSLLVNSTNTQEINSNSNNINEQTRSGIIVTDAVVDSNGDSLLVLQNTSFDNSLRISKIKSGNIEKEYSEIVPYGIKKTFLADNLKGACECNEGEENVLCDFTIETISANNITNSYTTQLNVDCVNDSTPKVSIIEPENKLSLEGEECTVNKDCIDGFSCGDGICKNEVYTDLENYSFINFRHIYFPNIEVDDVNFYSDINLFGAAVSSIHRQIFAFDQTNTNILLYGYFGDFSESDLNFYSQKNTWMILSLPPDNKFYIPTKNPDTNELFQQDWSQTRVYYTTDDPYLENILYTVDLSEVMENSSWKSVGEEGEYCERITHLCGEGLSCINQVCTQE